jgi:hypothetical protein
VHLGAGGGQGKLLFQPREQDGDALVEFLGTVIVRQGRRQRPEPGKFLRRQPMQAQPEQRLILVRVNDVLLQFVEEMAVKESVVGPVDVEGVRGS